MSALAEKSASPVDMRGCVKEKVKKQLNQHYTLLTTVSSPSPNVEADWQGEHILKERVIGSSRKVTDSRWRRVVMGNKSPSTREDDHYLLSLIECFGRDNTDNDEVQSGEPPHEAGRVTMVELIFGLNHDGSSSSGTYGQSFLLNVGV